ncbi:MAG: amidohydrolase family protein, partial [Deltaproteobacteria bacterium]|nr:amidohydrolase family protein [Deltaproteobacteria bacterium]
IGAGGSGCFISRDLQESWKFAVYLKSFGVTLEDLKREGDGLAIRKISEGVHASQQVSAAVVLAMDGVIREDGTLDREKSEIYIPNEFVAAEVAKYDNLYCGASINPYRPDALERLRRAANADAVLIKWLPSVMHIDPADLRIIPFYKELVRLGLPLLCHTGDERSFIRSRDELCDPKRLELPLSLGVTVIAAHIATTGTSEGEDNMARLISMFPRYPTLYADISSLTQINKRGCLSRALQHTGIHERLLYGTDFPLINTGLCTPMFHLFSIGPIQVFKLYRIQNSWDRDVKLKQALGVPEHVFSRPGHLLKIKSRQTVTSRIKQKPR